jgi:hemoglobin
MEQSLYEKLGEHRLKELLNNFYDLVFENEVIGHLFTTEKEDIKEKQRLFLTQFFGGPPLYTQRFGHPQLRARHLPHAISDESAVAWLSCMSEALTKTEMEEELRDEILKRLIPTAMFMVNRNNE